MLEYFAKILPSLLTGMLETLKIFGLTLLLALPLGLIVAMGAMAKSRIIKIISNIYIWLFRGTPLLLQLFFVYFALPLIEFPGGFSIKLSRFGAAILTFVLNYGAYFAEIYRAGIQSIDKGQFEACKTLSFTKAQTYRFVILPQVILRILPPVSNEVITLVKDTALVNVIAVPELLKSAKDAANRDVNPTAYILAALVYLCLTMLLTFLSRYLEKRLSRHKKEAD